MHFFSLFFFFFTYSLVRPYGDRLFCCRFCGTGDEEIAIAAAAAAAAGASSNNASQTAPVQQICVVPNESDDAAGKKVQSKSSGGWVFSLILGELNVWI